MNIVKFVKILVKKINYILILPILVGGLVYFLTKDLPLKYETESTIFTGITSNSGLDVIASRIDNVATQNEYNNVLSLFKSNSLFTEVSLKLLTQHLLLDKAQKDIISQDAYDDLQKYIPSAIKKLIVKNNFKKTYQNLFNYIKQDDSNFIYHLLNHGNKYYSIKAISNLKAVRLSQSDIIQISFESDDPGISFNTVKFTAETFIDNYSQLKFKQSNSAVEYFEKKLSEMTLKLNDAENRLLKFNVSNDVINYYEQTEQVTTQQEKIEIRLQETKMEYEASVAVLNKLEKEIDKRYKVDLRRNEILGLRTELVNCNNRLASLEIKSDVKFQSEIDNLKIRRQNLENKLTARVDSIYFYENKSQGIESQRILGQWLDALKNNQSNEAMLKSMKERQIDFMKQFKRFAPLGATIKRIEREIDIYEREYLNVLNNLNLALQRQQNTDMISDMKILDEPKFPVTSIPSKKKLYVIISALFAAIFYIIAILIIELLDSRIKSPLRLKQLTGLEVIGAFCLVDNKKLIYAEKLIIKSATFIFEKIRMLSAHTPKPFVIQLISVWDNSGKSYVGNILLQELQKRNFQTEVLDFTNSGIKDNDQTTGTNYPEKYLKFNSYAEIINSESIDKDFIISIIPTMSDGIENPVILKTADLTLVFYDANSTWNEADLFNLEKLKSLIDNNLFAVLTKADPENIEEIYGEVPKARSKFRIMVKTTIKRFS